MVSEYAKAGSYSAAHSADSRVDQMFKRICNLKRKELFALVHLLVAVGIASAMVNRHA